MTSMVLPRMHVGTTTRLCLRSSMVAAARERGVKLGRNRQIDYQGALQMRAAGALMREIGEVYGVSRAGVWRALRIAERESAT